MMIFFPNKALNRIQIYYIILTIQVNKSQPDKVPLGEGRVEVYYQHSNSVLILFYNKM